MSEIIRRVVSGVTALTLSMISFNATLPFDGINVSVMTAEAAASDFTAEQGAQWGRERVAEGWEVDVDGVFGCQCVDLIQAYGSFLGVHVPSLMAYEYESWSLPEGWTRTFGSPQIGDIFVMNPGDGSAGHVGMVTGVSGSSVTTAETNYWSERYLNAACREVTRDASKFTSFIHPNFKDPTPRGHEMSENEAAGQTIPDGDYWIMSRVKPLYRLDIYGSTVDIENCTNLEMCHNGYDDVTDVFHVEYLNNGFYKIKQYKSKYVIEVMNADKRREANVSMYIDNGSIAQQWSIEPTQTGYKIRSRANAYYMDIYCGNYVTAESTKNGDNVMTYDFNGNESLFTFIPYSEKNIIQDGTYTFSSAVGGYADAKGTTGKYQAGANVQLGDKEKYITFRIENVDQGYCKIYDDSTGLALQSANGYDGNYISTDCNFTLEKPDNSIRQLWTFRSAGEGKYYIISKLNGHYMDNADAKTSIGNNIRSVVYNGTPATQWKINPVELKSTSTTTSTTTITTSKTTTTKTSTTSKTTTKTSTTSKTTTKTSTTSKTTSSSATTVTTTASGELTVSETEVMISLGEKYTIKANQSGLTYKSSNEDVAVVSDKGVISGISNGTAVITVINKSKETASMKVTVAETKYGDANSDGNVDLSDAVLIMQSICNPSKYGTKGTDKNKMTAKGYKNADCCNVGDGVTNADALAIQKYKLSLIPSLPEK